MKAIASRDYCSKAVVAGPAGRRAPDHFLGRSSMLPAVSLFSRFGSFYILPLILFNLMQLSITIVARVFNRPT